MASERRCAGERATLAALHKHCQLCRPVGSRPFQQTRWHVLGQCQHPDLKDARRKAASELQAKTHTTFTQKIKDPRGRLPYWRQLFSITADDQWLWPDDEPGINAKSGWQISQWWGLWGPNRMDKWATDHQDQGNPVSAREWAALLRALQQLGWSALNQCRTVWKVFCRLRAGIDADVAAKAKTVAKRARQQRWRDAQTERV